MFTLLRLNFSYWLCSLAIHTNCKVLSFSLKITTKFNLSRPNLQNFPVRACPLDRACSAPARLAYIIKDFQIITCVTSLIISVRAQRFKWSGHYRLLAVLLEYHADYSILVFDLFAQVAESDPANAGLVGP